MRAPLPSNEAARLNALHQYKLLDTSAEKVFDDLTRLTAHICGTPTALISLLDINRQWFKSKVGFKASETSRNVAFSAHASDELEIRVEERTVELRKANEQLQSEIVERQWAELELRFLQKMTQAISESPDFHSALGVALRKVCEVTGWDFGEAWIPGLDGTTLECSPAWYGSTQSLEKFRRLSEGLTRFYRQKSEAACLQTAA